MELYPRVFLYRRLVQSKLFIDSNYAGKIDVDNIADEAYCSKYHFIRLFKKVYGKTPHQYLIFVRVEHAKILLKNNTSVNDACFSVGFESPTSFASLFKKATGMSPSAYRYYHKKIVKEQQEQPLRFIPGCITSKFGIEKEQF